MQASILANLSENEGGSDGRRDSDGSEQLTKRARLMDNDWFLPPTDSVKNAASGELASRALLIVLQYWMTPEVIGWICTTTIKT